MESQTFESAFSNPFVALLIGAAVSLDVVALTFCSAGIYFSDVRTWWRWAKYNAGWHAGLLITYLLLIDLLSVTIQYAALFISLPLPDWLAFLASPWNWIAEKFRSHIVIYAAIGAMAFVWWQYAQKIRSTPTEPEPRQSPFFLRGLFSKHQEDLRDKQSKWFWHLSACLVAVDMLALAAVVKSGEKLIQFPEGLNTFDSNIHELNRRIIESFDTSFLIATLVVTASVFLVVGLLCFLSAKLSRLFWERLSPDEDSMRRVSASFIVITLRLIEPLIIFYFIIHSMAFGICQ